MKRIKRFFCVTVILLSVLFLSACKKDYNAITYKRFKEKMADELNYSVSDNSIDYQDVYQRYISAMKDDISIIYMEFETEKEAHDFLKDSFYKEKYYKYKDYDDYSTVKYSKEGYLYMIQVDNIIISGSSDNTSSKYMINDALKELGY